MLKILFIFSLLLFGIDNCIANVDNSYNNLDKGKRLLLTDEKFVEALHFFTKEIKIAAYKKQKNVVAENIYWIAECLFQIRKLKELQEVLQIGEDFMKSNKLPETYKNLMLVKAKYLIDIGNNKDAIRLLVKQKKNKNDFAFLIAEKLILSDAYYRIGNLEKCKQIYQFVINNTNDSIKIAQAYNGIGCYYFMVSNFDSSLYYYNKSLRIYESKFGRYHTKVAMIKSNLGLLAISSGDYFTSKKNIEFALQIFQNKYGDYHPQTAEAYGIIGSIYKLQEDLEKAILFLNKESNIIKFIYGEESIKLIYSHLNLGEIFTISLSYNKAKIEILKALFLINKYYSKTSNLYIQCIVKLSVLKTQEQNYIEAEKLLTEVIQINKKSLNDYLPDAYYQLGCNNLAQHKFDKALSNFQEANKLYIYFFGDKNIYSIDPLTEISNTYLEKKDFIKALEYANLSLRQTVENNNIIFPYDHWQSILQVLKCKKEMYKYNLISSQNCKQDIELITKTIKEANAIKQTYYTTGSQISYADKMSELNVLGIYFLTHFYKKTDLFFLDNMLAFTENNKANLLRFKISNNASSQVLPKEVSYKLTFILYKLNTFISMNENNEESNFNINDSILFYQNLHESFTKNIEDNYPKIYAIKYGQKPFTILEIQQKIKDNYSFLIYCNDAENYYCFNISNKEINYKICGNKTIIDSLIQLNQANIINKKFDKKSIKELSNILLPKKLETNIIVSADAAIQNISFDALFQNNTFDYLIYNHTLQYAISTSIYFKHSPTLENKNILGFFPNFINTKNAVLNSIKEQESLQHFSNYIACKNSIATKKTFLQFFKTAKIIHVASHLITDTIFPLQSALLFQPNNDYLLTINDIWKLDGNADLITLAACRSNYGKHQNGEGLQNFVWAFQYAGAHNILSTQWNASDKSTSKIMSDFYKNLRSGKNKQEALRVAKINYLKDADAIGAQPFYWANYSLFADETTIDLEFSFYNKFWFVSIISLILSSIIFIFIKRNNLKR